MKKGWKIFWIVCGVTMVVGIICCVVSLSLGVTTEAVAKHFPKGYIGWGPDYDDDDFHHRNGAAVYEKTDLKKYPGVREIDMEMAAGNVVVELYDGADIEVETDDVLEQLKFRSYIEEDALKLETREHVAGINTGEDMGTVYLRIPRDMMLEDASLQIDVGELQVTDIKARELSVEVGVGSAVVQNFSATEASLECGTGSLEATGNVEAELDMENDIGDITCHITGNKKEYNYEITCGVGEVVIGDEVFYGRKSEEKINNNARKMMSLECGIGDIIVDFTGA